MSRLRLLFALAAVLAACPAVDDDDSTDDDDSAGDDDVAGDDDTAVACAQPGPPYTLEFTGDFAGNHTFDAFTCTDYNGDNWNLNYTSQDGWQLRLVVGPIAAGDNAGVSMDITLQNNAESASFSGRTSGGHVATLSIDDYETDVTPPCGSWTTDPIPAVAGGTTIALTPQPIPFRCP
jgi:hypothetical protein